MVADDDEGCTFKASNEGLGNVGGRRIEVEGRQTGRSIGAGERAEW